MPVPGFTNLLDCSLPQMDERRAFYEKVGRLSELHSVVV